MSTERLTCKGCGLEWDRKRVRGRKPKLCPACVHSPKPRKPGGRRNRPVVAITPEERADRLMEMLEAERHMFSQQDRRERLAKLLAARDYGRRR